MRPVFKCVAGPGFPLSAERPRPQSGVPLGSESGDDGEDDPEQTAAHGAPDHSDGRREVRAVHAGDGTGSQNFRRLSEPIHGGILRQTAAVSIGQSGGSARQGGLLRGEGTQAVVGLRQQRQELFLFSDVDRRETAVVRDD